MDNTTTNPVSNNKKFIIYKLNYFFKSLILVSCILLISGIILIVKHLNLPYSEKGCVLSKPNTDNTTLGNCIIHSQCDFEKNNNTYELIKDEIMILPTTFKTDERGSNCPLYRELPGYKSTLYNNCNDKGYGCCEVPLNIHCDKIMHFNLVYNYTINHSGFLYSKINQNKDKHYLNIPKEDLIGSNCPKLQDLACESFTSIYLTILYILSFILFNSRF